MDKAAKTQDSEHKAAKKQDASQVLTNKNVDFEGTQKELDAALAHFDKFKPLCVGAGVIYVDRLGRRRRRSSTIPGSRPWPTSSSCRTGGLPGQVQGAPRGVGMPECNPTSVRLFSGIPTPQG